MRRHGGESIIVRMCGFGDDEEGNIGDEDDGEDGDDEDVEDDEDDELEMMRTSKQVTKEVDGQRKDNCGVFLRGN